MRTTAIIQARMCSERLPNKVLADIDGKPMLGRVYDRVSQAKTVDTVIVAFPAADYDIYQWCIENGAHHYPAHGPDNDLVGRYYAAAYASDCIVRITADCPFIDPNLIDAAVGAWGNKKVDFVSNTMHRTFPRGLDVEVFGREFLRAVDQGLASDSPEREHPGEAVRKRVLGVSGIEALSGNYAEHRWTVDEQADLDFARAVYEKLADPLADWRTVLNTVQRHGLDTINAHVQQR